METLLAVVVGVLVTGSVYLMLSRHLVRFIFGLVLASNAVNLLIFAAGQVSRSGGRPPIIPEGAPGLPGDMANALPQALVLTAIVIGFALLTFVFVLFFRAGNELGTADTEAMRVAEPRPAGDDDGGSEGKGAP
jgi:multicomponent Na+:H+ antiporter subunit C